MNHIRIEQSWLDAVVKDAVLSNVENVYGMDNFQKLSDEDKRAAVCYATDKLLEELREKAGDENDDISKNAVQED